MHQAKSGLTGSIVLLIALVALAGCAQHDVNKLRGNYQAELNGWVVEEGPMGIVSDVATVEGGEVSDESAGGEEGEEAMPMVRAQTVILDIMVSHSGGGTLQGVTVDIWQADAEEQEKENWRIWVDTSDLGVSKQITHTIEGVSLGDQDRFSVEVRQFVPEGDRSAYKEFAEAP